MPRPKPQETLSCRQLRFSDTQWKTLQALGGAPWLREVLSLPEPSAFVTQQKTLIRRITADAAYLTTDQLAIKYDMAASTIKAKLR